MNHHFKDANMHALTIKICAITAISWGLCATTAVAQSGTKVAQLDNSTAQCKKELTQYIETLRYLRSTAGDKIADRVATGYASEADITRIASTDGYCSATQVLRDKKAIR